MTSAISGIVSAQLSDTPARAPVATKHKPLPEPSVDTVMLSQSTQVIQLNRQGRSPTQIAEVLGIPVFTVNSDLGIVAANVTSNPGGAPAATAQPAASPATKIAKSKSAA